MEGGAADGTESVLRLRKADIATRGFDQETIILDLRNSTYLSVNQAASVLWRELERGATRTQLVQSLLAEFDVSEERAARDVDAFVNDCRQRRLLDEGTASPDAG